MATAKAPHHISSREKLQQAYNLAGEVASEAADQLKERAKSSKQRAADVEQRMEASIKAHPVLSVGCAFAAGWLISKLLK